MIRGHAFKFSWKANQTNNAQSIAGEIEEMWLSELF